MKKQKIIDILKEQNRKLSADELFELTGYQNELSELKGFDQNRSIELVESFYAELKRALLSKEIIVEEIEKNGIKQGDILSYKER